MTRSESIVLGVEVIELRFISLHLFIAFLPVRDWRLRKPIRRCTQYSRELIQSDSLECLKCIAPDESSRVVKELVMSTVVDL